jgi:predicted metal-dependent hydrolase
MELSYEVVRSTRRKKLTITVDRDRTVVVHAPAKTTDHEIRDVIETKRAWLFEKIRHEQKYQDLPHPPGKELINGESALYLGREYRIEIANTSSRAVEFDLRFIIPKTHHAKRREVLKTWYLERAKKLILPRVHAHGNQLGVTFSQANIVDNRYRWGSCTVRDHVNFNWRLIKAPMFVVDYVIIHELAHLLEPNHTPGFWNIVHANAPHAEKAKSWLKQHGQLLEEEI